jgi:hypothetical protein
MKIKHLLAAMLILLICVTGSFPSCTASLNGDLPQFSIGDKWVSRWHTGGQEYIVTSEITGAENTDGIDCWVMETTFDPPYLGIVISTINKYDKTDLDIISSDYRTNQPGEFTSITYQISGTPYYPLSVGKESQEIDLQTITSGNSTIIQTENVTVITTTKVEKIETIKVEAGTFKCFKILKYDEKGKLIQVTWRSDKTKLFQVKIVDPSEEDGIYELISYSVH